MKHVLLPLVLLLCLPLSTASCGGAEASEPDALAGLKVDKKTTYREIIAVLETIQDVPTAEEGDPKLAALTDRIVALRERENGMSAEELTAMNESDEELMDLYGSMLNELVRLSLDEDLAPFVEEAYARLER
ncbi:MAG: hypothetical protein AAGB93_09350 [Planctomycetota bacterium]